MMDRLQNSVTKIAAIQQLVFDGNDSGEFYHRIKHVPLREIKACDYQNKSD